MGPVRGIVMLRLIYDAQTEVRLLSLVFEGRERLSTPVEPEGWRVARQGVHVSGEIAVSSVRSVPGRYPVTLRYRMAGWAEPRSGVIEIEIIAATYCQIEVRFTEDGPTASPCLQKIPTDYSGTWIN